MHTLVDRLFYLQIQVLEDFFGELRVIWWLFDRWTLAGLVLLPLDLLTDQLMSSALPLDCSLDLVNLRLLFIAQVILFNELLARAQRPQMIEPFIRVEKSDWVFLNLYLWRFVFDSLQEIFLGGAYCHSVGLNYVWNILVLGGCLLGWRWWHCFEETLRGLRLLQLWFLES